MKRKLWRHLWVWTLAALVLVWASLVAVSYSTGHHEAREITDGQLESAAWLVLGAPSGAAGVLESGPTGEYAPQLRIVRWRNGQTDWDSHGMAPRLPADLRDGAQTVRDSQGDVWRLLLMQRGAVRVAVMMAAERRSDLGADIADHIVRPALVVFPAVALLLAWAIRRGLRPLNRLSDEIGALDTAVGQTLEERHRYDELAAAVQAINRLVRQLQQQVERERTFAADVAHEMRTPLAAIVWQARAARQGDTPALRASALELTEQQALRAGRILSQLLALTRAQAQQGHDTAMLDLPALAAEVLAPFAQQAHTSGHTLALQVPHALAARQACGHRLMLELALRNLVDNALRHTPSGTQVEVALGEDPQGLWLAVHDDGRRTGVAETDQPHAAAPGEQGLGLGLRLTERLAHWQGLQLLREPAPAPFTTRFVLRWPPG